MSSKCDISARAASWFEVNEEECNDEDLEDLEPVNSGGELGPGAKLVIALLSSEFGASQRARL